MPVQLPGRAHVALVRCRVQFIGKAAPCDVSDGMSAIQKPLYELFSDLRPEDAVITVYTSGISLHAINSNSGDLWWPMQDLKECAAVRPVGNPPDRFVPIDGNRTKLGIPVFAFVFSRPDIPVDDCWAVITKSDEAALALLSASEMAHGNRAGWTTLGDRPPSMSQPSGISIKNKDDWDGAVARQKACSSGKTFPADYYEKPPLSGYFYSPGSGIIKDYNVDAVQTEVPALPCCDYPSIHVLPPQIDCYPAAAETTDIQILDSGYCPDQDCYGQQGYFVEYPCGDFQASLRCRGPQQAAYIVPEVAQQMGARRPATAGGFASGYFPGFQQPQTSDGGFFRDDPRMTYGRASVMVTPERQELLRGPKFVEEREFEQYLPGQPTFNQQAGGGAAAAGYYMRADRDGLYESHISPGGGGGVVCEAAECYPQDDGGPYERRLPSPAAGPSLRGALGQRRNVVPSQLHETQPKSLNGNFILRPAARNEYY